MEGATLETRGVGEVSQDEAQATLQLHLAEFTLQPAKNLGPPAQTYLRAFQIPPTTSATLSPDQIPYPRHTFLQKKTVQNLKQPSTDLAF